MSHKRAEALIRKYLEGTCTAEEKSMLESWYNQFSASSEEMPGEPDYNRLHKQLSAALPLGRPIIQLWKRLAVAASILIISSLGYLLLRSEQEQSATNQSIVENDITPGGNKAYLTLSDGKRIDLTNAANGEIARQAGIQITKTSDGQLIYTVSDLKSSTSGLMFNTIETPRGGQYQIRLPDGSQVWLNAASSLKYPASFAANKERRVVLTGEAYFEVAKDPSRLFIVKTDKQVVEVLGTHFNINSYTDEPSVKTTLLEGSVKVLQVGTQHSKLLKPGQEAVLTAADIKIRNTDPGYALAWKEGKFRSKSESLESLMRKIGRWYDVEVEYNDLQLKQQTFTGTLNRLDNVSNLLDIIKLTGEVDFEIEGRKIIVSK